MATANTKLEDIILRAVDIVASQKISKAGYDKTIQATVVSCIDATIGKYKVKYQDSYWIAYSNNVDSYYAPNTSVYILIPGGNMSKDKTILGTTKRLGVNYITVAEGDERFAPIGSNIITTSNNYNLCSYQTETRVLYSYDFNSEQNLLEIDNNAVIEYIKNSTSIIAGAHIKNNLNTQQRFQGNYGILFGLDFRDSSTNRVITRYFSIDVDNMNGDPYYYPNEVRQYDIFEIDGANFVRVNLIAIFTKDFPVQKNNMPNDIFISKIELGGAVSIEQEDLNSCALVLITPKGYIFTENSANNDTRSFEAQLRVKGKIIDTNSQKVDFYWFTENISITAASSKYNKYGGQGWQCLNPYRTVKAESTSGGVTTPAVLQFIPGSNIFSIRKSQIYAETTKYKCVAVYDNMILSKQAKIIRYDSQYQIEITSSNGVDFYNSSGTTILTCTCKQKNNGTTSQVPVSNLNFIWGSINSSGAFNSLPTTAEFNEDKAKLNSLYNAITRYINVEFLLNETLYNVSALLPSDSTINSISNSTQKTQVTNVKALLVNVGLSTTNAITTLLNKYNITTTSLTYRLVLDGNENNVYSIKSAINSYNSIQTVSQNKVFGIKVDNIINFSTFKCSVFTKIGNNFLGSASIVLTNSKNGNNYSLIINNGTQVFKYNTHGVAPTSKQNKEPLAIPALTFTIYDNLGNAIQEDVLNNIKTKWIVPNKNTLLRVNNYSGGIVDSTLETVTYQNLKTFSYTIAENYNVNHKINNIELKVEYNGLTLTAQTNLSFLKQGQNSTNGTDFVCKIIPNVLSGDVPQNPTIYYNGSTISFNWNNDTTNNKWFKAQLWHNGNTPIFEGTESANSTEGKAVTIVKWEVLKNIYASNKTDSTNLTVTRGTSNGSWSFGFSNTTFSSSYGNSYTTWRPANIIKVTLSYDGITYYATLPIITCRIFNNNYKSQLKDYTGFREVLYSSSGQKPQYDSHAPFEILTYYKTGNNWEDISNKTTSSYQLGYEWYYLGSVWNKDGSGTWSENYETTSSTTQAGDSSKKWLLKSNVISTTKINQKAIKPADTYNGECVNIALACRVYLISGNTTVTWIHIPIHMMRNRFENSAINGWDGNSVNLGGDNGGMILAPQVGAGVKDSNNRFTGIFIGTSKDPQADVSGNVNNLGSTNEDVGLFGYNSGSRSIFLDAKTGKAVFGQQGQAQIIINPAEKVNGRTTAKIYSGNYAYKTSNTAGAGFLIDLTTPEMKFGTGNFEVNSSGHLIAKGGGQIAGWQINDNAIFNKKTATGVNRNATGMNANPVIDSTSTSINNTGNGSEYRAVSMPPTTSGEGTNGYKTVGKSAAFWAGGSKFFVTHDGYLKAQQASIGSGSKPIFIGKSSISGSNESAIFSGLKSSKTSNQTGFYLGTDGFAVGSTTSVSIGNNQSQTVSNFQVDNDGTMFARKGYIGDGRTGWQIGSNYLKNGKTSYNQTTNDGVYLGTSGIGLGKGKFYVNSAGELHSTSGQIANWKISTDSIRSADNATYSGSSGMYFGSSGLRLGSHFHVDSSGNFYANSGTIENGVTINGTLSAANITTGTVNSKTVDWDQVTIVNSIKIHWKRIDYMSNFSVSGDTFYWTNNWQEIPDSFKWETITLYLLVNQGAHNYYDNANSQDSFNNNDYVNHGSNYQEIDNSNGLIEDING